MTQPNPPKIDGGALMRGVVLGAIVGGAVALFRAPLMRPRSSPRQPVAAVQNRSTSIASEANAPADPVAESRAQGRAAAQRRRAEMDL